MILVMVNRGRFGAPTNGINIGGMFNLHQCLPAGVPSRSAILEPPHNREGNIMFKRILVPLDGSHTATLGLQQAVKMAKAGEAKLRLISVVDDMAVAQNFDAGFDTGFLFAELKAGAKRAIANGVALAHRHQLKVETALFETLSQRVADVIVREAAKWKADVIVMGTHGRRGLNRLVLGSDAESVLRNAHCPVLMVRSKAKKKPVRSR